MLKLLRIDDRLIHGQVAFSWVAATNVSRIIVGNDEYANNKMLKMTLSIGKPPNIKMDVLQLIETIELLNSGNVNLEKTMVVVKDVEDALTLCKKVDDIERVCLGGVRDGNGKKLVHSQVFLSTEEIEMIKEMIELGKDVFAQDVPANSKISGTEIINKY